TLWCQDLIFDLEEIERRLADLRFLGVKGTTGTQASFLALFDGDGARVEALDRMVATTFGFERTYPVSGQTYSRKIDSQVVSSLGGIAESAHRFGTDLRLLAHEREVEEPVEADQIGSSAMAYKQNPMRAERLCSLARFVISLESNAAATLAVQWLERTLDDSANRRLVLPQSFLATDAVLILCQNVTSGLVVYPRVISANLEAELPFMATENILMAAVAAGGDRQDLHERIRQHSLAAAAVVKIDGGKNDLIDRIAADPAFAKVDLTCLLDPAQFVGRAPQQVDEFLAEQIKPMLKKYGDRLRDEADVRV